MKTEIQTLSAYSNAPQLPPSFQRPAAPAVAYDLPPSVDTTRFYRGINQMREIAETLRTARNPLMQIADRPETAGVLIAKAGDTALYVLAYPFCSYLADVCRKHNITPPPPFEIMETAISVIQANYWLTMHDVVLFGLSLTKGGIHSHKNALEGYPDHFRNLNEGWVLLCLKAYQNAKTAAQAEKRRIAEREERNRRPSETQFPELKEKIKTFQLQRINRLFELTTKETFEETAAPPRPTVTANDRVVFAELLPELQTLDRETIYLKMKVLQKNGYSIWVLFDEFLNTNYIT